MPEAVYSHSMAVLENGDILVTGGYNCISCFLFKSERREWEKGPDIMGEAYRYIGK